MQQAFATIGRSDNRARLSELAKETGLDDSTVSRILQSGIYSGLFIRHERGVYGLGMGAVELGFQALANATDDEPTQAALAELREKCDNALVFLYMLAPFRGLGRQCIDMAVGDSDLAELGMTPKDVLVTTRSLRTGASGRAILAYLPEHIQESVINGPLPAESGPGLIRDNEEFRRSLQQIRDGGYAIGYQECMAGWTSVAAPIIYSDAVMGAVLLLRPVEVMPEPGERCIDAVKQTAAHLSRLGAGSWPTYS